MKTLATALTCMGFALAFLSPAQQPVKSPPVDLQPSVFADQRIEQAKHQVALNPKRVQSLNDLALAYLRRAREQDNITDLAEAARITAQGLVLEPANFPLQKTQIALLLAEHRYPEARDKAAQLNRRTPDDVTLYGDLAEADLALGNYPEAEKSAQWMLNMLPNNVPGLLLAARLRVLYGDPEGALELLDLAYTETSPVEAGDLAWISNQIAAVDLETGNIQAAQAILERSRQALPNDPYTLANLARVQLAQHHPTEALALFRSATAITTDPHLLDEAARAAEAANQPAEAQELYVRFRQAVAANPTQSDAARLDLILLEAGKPATAPVALKLAEAEIAARHDVWTLDAYAWALYANGRYPDAMASLQKALDVGIQDARIDDHAGHIEQKLNQPEKAAKFFAMATLANPARPPAIEPSATPAAAVLPAPPPVSALAAFAPVPAALLIPQPTDTERTIHNAQTRIARNASDAPGYAALGAAYFQRARETGNVDDYELAERSLNKSLDLVSSDFSADAALNTMAEVCMGEHRFADALAYAQKALATGSGDVSPFAIVGDAYADMGEYEKARLAYARLTPPEMTLSPRAAYARDSRLSYLKFIAGDTPAAVALMKTSVAEGTEARLPSENLAWLYYELGEYLAQAGDAPAADIAYVSALTIHPGDYRALAALGKLRANRGSYPEAIVLYQAAIAVIPMPLFVAELGDLYRRSGNLAEAKKQDQLVEYIGLLGSINQVLHNRDLALFYTDHDMKLPEALKLAQKEFEVRHDIYTWDALAWALYKSGRLPEAAAASQKARQFGTRDAILFFHAAMIEDKMGNQPQAAKDLDQALAINPNFSLLYAQQAKNKQAELQIQASASQKQTSATQKQTSASQKQASYTQDRSQHAQ